MKSTKIHTQAKGIEEIKYKISLIIEISEIYTRKKIQTGYRNSNIIVAKKYKNKQAKKCKLVSPKT